MSAGKPSRLEQQDRAMFDPMYLSEVLGYDLHSVPHGLELVHSIGPKIVSTGKPKEAVPFVDLDHIKSRLVLWSRGHGKTSAAALYIVQLLLCYPDIRVLIMQSTSKNTRGLLREIKSHFDGSNERSKLPSLFPDSCKTKARLGKADEFTIPSRKRTHLREASVTVASPKSHKTGLHFDFQLYDDLVSSSNYRNQILQDNLVDEFNHLTPLLEPGGFKTVTGTRYSFTDLYGYIIKRDQDRNEWAISIKNCWKDGDPAKGVLFPEVTTAEGRVWGFTAERLESIRRDDPIQFSFQYLNSPIASGRALFTAEMLMGAVRAVSPDQVSALGPPLLFIDLASSKSKGADNSVIVCGRQANGRVYTCDILSGKWDSAFEIANNVIMMVLRHRPVRVEIEGTAAGKYFIDYVRLIAREKGITVPIEPIKVNNQDDAKDLRISALEGAIRTGKLLFLLGLPNWDFVAKQFINWQPGYRGRKDDEIDTLALMMQFYAQNGDVYHHQKQYTLLDYITHPQPLPEIVQRASEPPLYAETLGSGF